jgi:hypothetical protein
MISLDMGSSLLGLPIYVWPPIRQENNDGFKAWGVDMFTADEETDGGAPSGISVLFLMKIQSEYLTVLWRCYLPGALMWITICPGFRGPYRRRRQHGLGYPSIG